MTTQSIPTLRLAASTQKFVQGVLRASKAVRELAENAEKAQRKIASDLLKIEAVTRQSSKKTVAALKAQGTAHKIAATEAQKSATATAAAMGKTATAAQRASDKTAKAGKKAGQGFQDLPKEANKASRGVAGAFDRLGGRIERVADGLVSKIKSVTGALGLLVAASTAGAAGKKAVTFAASFDEGLAQVNTLLDEGTVPIERYRGQLLKLSETTSKELLDVTRGLYQTISAGIPATEGAGGAMDVLTQAVRAAEAGLGETEETVRLFASILNTYSDEGLTAADVSDKLFATVKQGITTLPELAGSLSRVVPVAQSFGISLDELLGSLAAMTKTGLSTNEAVTQLRSTILALARPSQGVREEFERMGIEIGESAFRSKGLVGVLQEIAGATGQSADRIAELFPNVRALVGALILSKNGGATYEKAIQGVAQSTGATDRALQKMEGNFGRLLKILKSQVQSALVSVGQKGFGPLRSFIEDFGEALNNNKEEIGDFFETVLRILTGVARLIASAGPQILLFFGTMFAAKRILAAAVAFTKFGKIVKETFENTRAAARGGSNAGTAWADGFRGKLQRVKGGLKGVLVGLLKSPSILGLAVSLGALIVDKIIEGASGRAAIERSTKAASAAAEKVAKDLGFANAEEQRQFEDEVRRGLRVAPTDAAFRKEESQPLSEAAGSFDGLANIADSLNRAEQSLPAFERAIQEARDRVNALKSQVQAVPSGSRIDEIVRLREQRFDPRLGDGGQAATQAQLDRLLDEEEKRTPNIRAQIGEIEQRRQANARVQAELEKAQEQLNKAVDELTVGRKRVQVLQAQTITEQGPPLPDSTQGGSGADKGKDKDEGTGRANEVARLRGEAALQALENAQDALDLRRESLELSAGEIAALQRQGQTEAQLAALKGARLEEAIGLSDTEQGLIEKTAAVQIQLARETAQAEITEAKGSAELQAAIRQKLDADIEAIEVERDGRLREVNNRRLEEQAQLATLSIEAAKRIGQSFQEAFSGGAAADASGGLGQEVQEALSIADDLTAGFFSSLGSGVSGATVDFFEAVSLGGDEALGTFAKAVSEVAGGIKNGISAGVSGIGSGISAAAQFIDEFTGGFFSSTFGRLSAGVTALVGKYGEELKKAGMFLLEGAISGLQAASSAVLGFVQGLVGPILRAAASPLQGIRTALGAGLRELTAPTDEDRAVDTLERRIDRLQRRRQAAANVGNDGQVSDLDRQLSTAREERRIALEESRLAQGQRGARAGERFGRELERVVETARALAQALPEFAGRALDAIVRALPEIVANVGDALAQLIPRIARRLPALVSGLVNAAARALPRIIRALGKAIPLVVEAVINGIVGQLRALPSMVQAFLETIVEALPGLFKALAQGIPEIIDAFADAIPAVISTFLDNLPLIIEELIAGAGEIVGALIAKAPEIVGSLIAQLPRLVGALIALVPRVISGIVKGLGRALVGIFQGIAKFFTEGLKNLFNEIIARIKSLTSLGGKDGGIVGGAVRGVRKFLGFHTGGMIPARGRNVQAAAMMQALGAPAFNGGGMVSGLSLGSIVRQAVAGVQPLQRDDVPAVLQAGEAVLNRDRGVPAAGGPNGVALLNQGVSPQGGPMVAEVVLNARDGAAAALLRQMVGAVSVSLKQPVNGLRQGLDDEGQVPFGQVLAKKNK
ncbi:MAG: phage tail tape measure protein [Bradymonadia bacterium]